MDETIEQLMEAALANDADAQWDLAVCYAQGNGVEQNNEKAFEWVCRAAENGHEGAANYVLDAYENGKEELGIQPDIEKLVEWADKLSENGSGPMSARLKYALLTMKGIKNTDPVLALERVEKFADKGNISFALYAYYLCDLIGMLNINAEIWDSSYFERAIKYMNMCDGTFSEIISAEKKSDTWYNYGITLTKKNKNAEAIHWFEMAIPHIIEAEMLYAIFSAAQIKDTNSPLWVEVYTHAKHAAERNDCAKRAKRKHLEGITCALLSQLTRDGLGTPVDLDASYRWCVRAAELGDETSKQRLPHYHKKLFGGYTFK